MISKSRETWPRVDTSRRFVSRSTSCSLAHGTTTESNMRLSVDPARPGEVCTDERSKAGKLTFLFFTTGANYLLLRPSESARSAPCGQSGRLDADVEDGEVILVNPLPLRQGSKECG